MDGLFGMKLFKLIMSLLLLSLSHQLQAVEQLEIQALMPGMVVLTIDGERVTLKTNQVSPQGVKMISANTKSTVLEIDGQQKTYQMGTTISTSFTQREEISEQIIFDKHGMFKSHGSINGQSVALLVDTGATSVAMSEKDARKLGIQYRIDGQETRTSTASGIAKAWRVKLKTVRLGQLVERNVEGVVVEGNYPRIILLGMTFLNRMKVEKEGNKMIITKKK